MGDYAQYLGQQQHPGMTWDKSYDSVYPLPKPFTAKKPGPSEVRQDRLDASPTLAEIWRRRGMLGQKAMDKAGTKYQIGG